MLLKGEIMNMRRIMPRLAIVAALSVSLAGCDYYSMLMARKNFKEANGLYTQAEYERAAHAYELTVANAGAFEAAPELRVAYFYLGNSYDQMYRPSRRGEPENDVLLEKAVENYRLASEQIIDNPDMQRLSMEYLVATYGPDKLNNPGAAEPIIRRMIELNPDEVANHFALARLYEDAGQAEEAESILRRVVSLQPNDPSVYLQLAAFFNRQEMFEETITALRDRARIEPDNPEAYYTLATYFWEKAFRDFRLNEEEQAGYVAEGIVAVDQALELKDDYHEAMTYKNILLRMQANATTNKSAQDALIAEADELRTRAEELRLEQQERAVAAAAASSGG
ncbi:MAG: tetratricopeptide repeat protein [Acidobacteriota bacterium]|nr:tetratricopeptide repeat protein [Acidobacteriota bacterium]